MKILQKKRFWCNYFAFVFSLFFCFLTLAYLGLDSLHMDNVNWEVNELKKKIAELKTWQDYYELRIVMLQDFEQYRWRCGQ